MAATSPSPAMRTKRHCGVWTPRANAHRLANSSLATVREGLITTTPSATCTKKIPCKHTQSHVSLRHRSVYKDRQPRPRRNKPCNRSCVWRHARRPLPTSPYTHSYTHTHTHTCGHRDICTHSGTHSDPRGAPMRTPEPLDDLSRHSVVCHGISSMLPRGTAFAKSSFFIVSTEVAHLYLRGAAPSGASAVASAAMRLGRAGLVHFKAAAPPVPGHSSGTYAHTYGKAQGRSPPHVSPSALPLRDTVPTHMYAHNCPTPASVTHLSLSCVCVCKGGGSCLCGRAQSGSGGSPHWAHGVPRGLLLLLRRASWPSASLALAPAGPPPPQTPPHP
jgi:hypothetical protein